jgi:DNA segregation ATPase FtsK/SpoIIIE, S-DNA-T family
MVERRSVKLDLLALALMALVGFLGAALWSYDPADPPGALVLPENAEPANLCGQWGATAARLLFEGFGLGAYYVLISLAALDAALLGRRRLGQPILRLVGWLLSLVGLCTLAAMAVPGWSPGPVIGAGGYLGAAARGWMQTQFASVGACILTLSLLVGGLLLCTDYLMVRLLAFAVGAPLRGLGRGMVRVSGAYARKLQPRRSDLDGFDADEDEEEDEGAGAAGGVAVRIAGRAADEPAESPTPAHETDDAVPADEPAERPPRFVHKGLASLLGAARSKPSERRKLIEQIEAGGSDLSSRPGDYQLPSLDLLLPGETFPFEEHEKQVRRKARILEKTFADFGFRIRVVEIQTGPVIAQFEVELEAGLRLSKITGLADDLAIALRVPSVRIVAPLPGKNSVGIEVPNHERQLVRLREVIEEADGKAARMRIPIFLGKDVAGNAMVVDLTTLPHLLIAGRTGTGKSVCLNSIIVSMLMTRRPDEVRLLLIDPKMVELSPYKSLPHLMHPVVTDMRKAEAILAWAVEKMEERYHLLARAGVRHVSVYNQLGEEELLERIQPEDDEERKQIPTHMPYVVIVADELADLMMTAAKEVEAHIIRLAQKSRAVGIHLVLATQKPTVDVITGLIKSNLPARISFQVASRTDSRVVLDEMGADKLLGNGDMLFLWPGTSTLIRGQGTYLSDDEINAVIAAVATSEPQFVKELVQLKAKEAAGGQVGPTFSHRDDLYETAVELVIREGRGSVSLLQRALGIGYGRAARLIDFMAEDGIVGAYNGSQARDVLISLGDWENRNAPAEESAGRPVRAAPAAVLPATRPRRSNKIVFSEPARGPSQAGPTAADEECPAVPPWMEDEDDGEEPEETDDYDEEEEEEDYEEEDDFEVEEFDEEADQRGEESEEPGGLRPAESA